MVYIYSKPRNPNTLSLSALSSLIVLINIFISKQYQRARRVFLREYKLNIPQKCPYTFEELMNRYPLDDNQ